MREQEYVLKHQYAGSLTQSSVRATFADSLSQYSKHSDDMGGHGTELEVRSTHHIKGIYSNKKKHNEKFGKTQKKLPDLATSGYNESYAKKPIGGFASDSDEYLAAAQLPMIKGGGSIHAQNVADAYILSNQATAHMKNK